MMNQTSSLALAIPCALALFAGACSSDIDQPSDADYDDIAQSVSPLIQNDLAENGNAVLATRLTLGDMPSWLSFETSGTATGQAGGLTWSFSASCADASGVTLDICDATTDAADVAASVSGNLALPNYAASMDAEAAWSISGLQGTERAIAGHSVLTASSDFTGIFRPIRRTFDLAFEGDYDLVVPRDAPDEMRGSLTAELDARRTASGPNGDSDAHFQVELSVTLDGSGTATVVIDGSAHYQLDLASGAIVRIDI